MIDGANLAHRCRSAWCASVGGKIASKDQLTGWPIVYFFLRSLQSLVEELSPAKRWIFALESIPKSRIEFYPLYKHKRRNARQEAENSRIDSSLEAMVADWESKQMRRCKEIVECVLPISCCSYDDHEADDICAAFAYYCKDQQVIIASGDSDMKQLLVFPNVSVYDLSKKPRSFLPPLDQDEPADKDPARWKAVVGDSTDDVPGITGEVTARKLLLDEASFQHALDTKKCRCQSDKGKSWREVYDRNLKIVSLTGDNRLFPLVDPRGALDNDPTEFIDEAMEYVASSMGFESWFSDGWTPSGKKVIEAWQRASFNARQL